MDAAGRDLFRLHCPDADGDDGVGVAITDGGAQRSVADRDDARRSSFHRADAGGVYQSCVDRVHGPDSMVGRRHQRGRASERDAVGIGGMMDKRVPRLAIASIALCFAGAAAADEAAAKKWIDQEFQPSTLSKDQQLAELKWFIGAARQ